ncbi:MAG TPA: hypothetical protein GXX38_05705 [Clostridia bacterium]|nr:hypothetical protein [Clostridia bacterium]
MKARVGCFLLLLVILCFFLSGCSVLDIVSYQLYIKSDQDYLPVTNYMIPRCKEIYCIIGYKKAIPNTELRARWFYLENKRELINETTYLIEQPSGSICFYLKSETDFKPGKYSLELLDKENKIWEEIFMVNNFTEGNFKIIDYAFATEVVNKIYPIGRTNNYLSGTKSFCFWFHYQKASGRQKITGKWYLERGEDDLLLAESQMMVEEGSGYGEFIVAKEQQFLTGKYRLDLYLDEQLYDSYFFRVL